MSRAKFARGVFMSKIDIFSPFLININFCVTRNMICAMKCLCKLFEILGYTFVWEASLETDSVYNCNLTWTSDSDLVLYSFVVEGTASDGYRDTLTLPLFIQWPPIQVSACDIKRVQSTMYNPEVDYNDQLAPKYFKFHRQFWGE